MPDDLAEDQARWPGCGSHLMTKLRVVPDDLAEGHARWPGWGSCLTTWLRECSRAAFRCLHSVVYYAGRQQSTRKSDTLQALVFKMLQAEGSGEGSRDIRCPASTQSKPLPCHLSWKGDGDGWNTIMLTLPADHCSVCHGDDSHRESAKETWWSSPMREMKEHGSLWGRVECKGAGRCWWRIFVEASCATLARGVVSEWVSEWMHFLQQKESVLSQSKCCVFKHKMCWRKPACVK